MGKLSFIMDGTEPDFVYLEILWKRHRPGLLLATGLLIGAGLIVAFTGGAAGWAVGLFAVGFLLLLAAMRFDAYHAMPLELRRQDWNVNWGAGFKARERYRWLHYGWLYGVVILCFAGYFWYVLGLVGESALGYLFIGLTIALGLVALGLWIAAVRGR